MKLISMKTNTSGARRYLETSGARVPDGFAVIPEGMPVPDTLPFVDIVVVDGVVVSMTAGEVPEREQPPVPTPTMEERVSEVEMTTAELTEALELLLSGDNGEEVVADGDEA